MNLVCALHGDCVPRHMYRALTPAENDLGANRIWVPNQNDKIAKFFRPPTIPHTPLFDVDWTERRYLYSVRRPLPSACSFRRNGPLTLQQKAGFAEWSGFWDSQKDKGKETRFQ